MQYQLIAFLSFPVGCKYSSPKEKRTIKPSFRLVVIRSFESENIGMHSSAKSETKPNMRGIATLRVVSSSQLPVVANAVKP